MKLNEVDDEFENVKDHSAEVKLKFAQQRTSSIHHQMYVIKHKLQNFKDRFITYRFHRLTDEEKSKGYMAFVMGNDSGKCAVYHILTPQEISLVGSLWKKIETLQPLLKKSEQSISRYKLELKKTNGTYVSHQQVNKCEFDFQKEIMKLVESVIGSNYTTNARGSRTKKNGTSRVTISINLAPGSTHTINEEFKKTVTTAIKSWFKANEFTYSRVAYSAEINSSIIASLGVLAQTAELIKRYHKKAGG